MTRLHSLLLVALASMSLLALQLGADWSLQLALMLAVGAVYGAALAAERWQRHWRQVEAHLDLAERAAKAALVRQLLAQVHAGSATRTLLVQQQPLRLVELHQSPDRP